MNDSAIESKVKNSIRQIPDFPKPGINFFDITTILQDGELFHEVIEALASRYKNKQIDAIVGIESRGFIFGSSLATKLKTAFVPIRKSGKLPSDTEKASYQLEYGEDTLEIHKDALKPGDKVLVVDDLLATGGTARASLDLIEKLGASIEEFAFIIELTFLNGREKLKPVNTISVVKYESE